MTDSRVTQAITEVAETPTTVDRRVSQAIAEVAEVPTTVERRVSQVILEVAYTVGGPFWGWGNAPGWSAI